MTSKLLILIILLTSFSVAEPLPNIGPKGSWSSNGRWHLKVNDLFLADDLQEFRALPFTKGIVSAKGQEYTAQVERLVFRKKGRFLILDVSLKNAGNGIQKIGSDTPPWHVRCNDGQEVRNTGSVSQGAIAFFAGALPKFGPVEPGKVIRGKMAFVLPSDTEPRLLFFKASTSIAKYTGKSESLVSRLIESGGTGARAIKPNRPETKWSSNGKWKMRLTHSGLVNSVEEYKALPWSERLKGAQLKKHLGYVERNIFGKKGRVLLVKVETKNLTDRKQKLGYELPFWRLHGADGKILKLSGVYQQQMGWALVGGLPKKSLLNSKARTGGFFGFFLPEGFQPAYLDFEVPKSLEKNYGASGSIKFENL